MFRGRGRKRIKEDVEREMNNQIGKAPRGIAASFRSGDVGWEKADDGLWLFGVGAGVD